LWPSFFWVCTIREKRYYDSERLISALGLTGHCGASPFENTGRHVPVSGVTFLVRKTSLMVQKVGNFLARLFADARPCLVYAALLDGSQMPRERRIG
jgi:hypothetical protein